MPTKTTPKPARDPGLTIRVPLAILEKLREKALEVGTSPLLSFGETVSRLALRALEIGAASPKLVPKE